MEASSIKQLIFLAIVVVALSCSHERANNSFVLHNGICLPNCWPPKYDEPEQRGMMPIPYLEKKPNVIPVDVGRQLFVDDYLVWATDLETICHTPELFIGNPVLFPVEEWEKTSEGVPYAAPFSDGVWYDEAEGKFKLWYLTGGYAVGKRFCTAYAESTDGRNWIKPQLDIVPGTNLVDTCERDASTVWLDKQEIDPIKRYKFFNVERNIANNSWQFVLKYSSDGIHWTKGVAQSGDILDRSSAFYNPFRGVWCLSLRHKTAVSARSRAYLESDTAEDAVSKAHRIKADAEDQNVVFWFTPDTLESRHPEYPDIDPGIYHFDCIPYESIILGQYSVWQGPENADCQKFGVQKRNEVMLGFSRDGFHFSRPSHQAFIGVNPIANAWNWGNVQSVGGAPLIVGDSLYFYVSGRRLNPFHWDAYSSCGLATLRRDGFVSRRAGKHGGYLITELLTFKGKYLFINANVRGSIRVEVLSEQGKILQESPVFGPFNATKKMVLDLSRFTTKKVRLRFSLFDGDLYAFWVSPWSSGESLGYTAGGGPGLSSDGVDKHI